MAVNLDKPQRWKDDIARSVDMYNAWFMAFAPDAFRSTRIQTTAHVVAALATTQNLTDLSAGILKAHPEILPTLRMSTCPPIAVDRLIGLAGITPSVVKKIELERKIPTRMATADLDRELEKIGVIIKKMVDPDIFVWLGRASRDRSGNPPSSNYRGGPSLWRGCQPHYPERSGEAAACSH